MLLWAFVLWGFSATVDTINVLSEKWVKRSERLDQAALV